jgi:hypothetical protein
LTAVTSPAPVLRRHSPFAGARFSGGEVGFYGAVFSGGTVSFDFSGFSSGTVDFTGDQFSGGTVDLLTAQFSGSEVDFSGADDWSSPPAFSQGTHRNAASRGKAPQEGRSIPDVGPPEPWPGFTTGCCHLTGRHACRAIQAVVNGRQHRNLAVDRYGRGPPVGGRCKSPGEQDGEQANGDIKLRRATYSN